MIKKLITALLLSSILSACGSDPHSDLLGLWELQDRGMHYHPKVIRILKDGDEYIYKDEMNFEISEYQVILRKEGGKFFLDTRFIPDEPLGLINNKSTLLIGQRKFKRIDQAKLDAVLAETPLKQRGPNQTKASTN